jgi:uncharacterized membrane protein YvbJ
MVYCTKCGANNSDDARVCTQCGVSLYTVREERERYSRKPDEECFGIENIPRAGPIVGIIFGVIIILAGLLWLLKEAHIIPPWIEIWPFALMIFGVLIVIGGIYGTRRR